MKRFTVILMALALLVSLGGIAMADDCLLYGCGILKGTVYRCGSWYGQEDATVALRANYPAGWASLQDVTDAQGYYEFQGNLGVCMIHMGQITAEFRQINCCDIPNQLFRGIARYRFRLFHEAEQQVQTKNITMRYAGTF